MEYMGVVSSRMESVDEFKERMASVPGLYGRGRRRRYYSPIDPSAYGTNTPVAYTKLTYDDLNIPYERLLEYPV
jgi:hypothetical protein